MALSEIHQRLRGHLLNELHVSFKGLSFLKNCFRPESGTLAIAFLDIAAKTTVNLPACILRPLQCMKAAMHA